MISSPSSCPVQTATFNIWPNLASWVIFEIYPPRPFNMLNKWSKLTCRVRVIKIFCASDVTKQYVEPTKLSSQVISKIYPPLDPTRQYIQHIKPTWHLEWCLKCFFPPLHIIALNIEHIMSIFCTPKTSTKQYIWKQNKTSILSSFSPPARWRFLDFNKGATPSSSSSPSSPSLLPRRLWMQWSAARPECHAARSGCLDPTAISRAQEAVERAWTRTNRMAEYTSDTMPERMSDRISEYICHKYFQMVCRKLCQNI